MWQAALFVCGHVRLDAHIGWCLVWKAIFKVISFIKIVAIFGIIGLFPSFQDCLHIDFLLKEYNLEELGAINEEIEEDLELLKDDDKQELQSLKYFDSEKTVRPLSKKQEDFLSETHNLNSKLTLKSKCSSWNDG